jgi:hypothetical protein
MTTIRQIADSDSVWSLEEDHGSFFLHYVADEDSDRVVVPVPLIVLEQMASRARDAVTISDRRQNAIQFRRAS